MIIVLIVSGCVATTMHTYQAAGNRIICEGNGLGKIAVLPEFAWRQDQKEPEKRELMALEVIERSFQGITCGSISQPGGIREVSSWSGKPESELLIQFAEEGIDTIIIIRIEELTPRLQITYSLPQAGRVVLKIYNIKGQVIKTLIDKFQPAGDKTVVWDGLDMHGQKTASGIYLYQLQAGAYIDVKKMILIE